MDTHDFVVPLASLTKSHRDRAGGKAVELAAMIRSGVRVPDGFVILCNAPIESPDLQNQVLARVKELGAALVAVRSSARTEDGRESSCAGLFETRLNVARSGVISAVMEVLESGKRGGLLRADMAVIVQSMVDAHQAGVCFSVDPVGSQSQVLVEAVDGFGESLVSGVVTPRRYRINRNNFEVRGDPPKDPRSVPVAPRHLHELAELALQLEQSTGTPVDLEWAICNDELHLLQCRPITAIMAAEHEAEAKANWRYIWSTAEPMWMMEVGLQTRAGLLPDGVSAPRLWTFADLFYLKRGGTYECYVSEEQASAFHPDPASVVEMLDRTDRDWPEQQRYFAELHDLNWSALTTRELRESFTRAQRFYATQIGLYSATSSLVTRAFENDLQSALRGDELYTLLRAPAPDQMELEQSDWALLVGGGLFRRDLALDHARNHPFIALGLLSEDAVVDALEALFVAAGDRRRAGVSAEDRDALRRRQDDILLRHEELRDTTAILHRMSASRMRVKRGWAGLSFHLLGFFEELSRRFAESAHDLQTLYRTHEIQALIRDGTVLDPATKQRRRIGCLWTVHDGVMDVLEGEGALEVFHASVGGHDSGALITGDVACPGEAEGVARVVLCNDAASMAAARSRFQRGDILVTEMVQPSMVDLVEKAAAVITNEGGMLSHAAIVARELGVPCVVATGNATKVVLDGEWLVLRRDGNVERSEAPVVETQAAAIWTSAVPNSPG